MQQWHRRWLSRLFAPLSLEDLCVGAWCLVDTHHDMGCVTCVFVSGEERGRLVFRLADESNASLWPTKHIAISIEGGSVFTEAMQVLGMVVQKNERPLEGNDRVSFLYPHIASVAYVSEWAGYLENLGTPVLRQEAVLPEHILIIGDIPTKCPHTALLLWGWCSVLSRQGVEVDLVLEAHIFKELYQRDELEAVANLCTPDEVRTSYEMAVAFGYTKTFVDLFEQSTEWHLFDIHPNYQIEELEHLVVSVPTEVVLYNFYPAFSSSFLRTVERHWGALEHVQVQYRLVPFPTPVEALQQHVCSCAWGEGEVLAVGQNQRDFDTYLQAMAHIPVPGRVITYVRDETFSVPFPAWVTCSSTGESVWQFIQSLAHARIVVIPLYDDAHITSGITCLFWALALNRTVVIADTPSIRPFLDVGGKVYTYVPGDATNLQQVLKEALHTSTALSSSALMDEHCALPAFLSHYLWRPHGTH